MKGKNTIIIASLALIVAVFLLWFFVFRTSATKYTVSFDTNGGSTIKDVMVEENKTVKRPANPTKSGYTFVEWQLNGISYNFNSKVTKDITLKAVWSEKSNKDGITVTFSLGDGKTTTQTLKSGELLEKPEDPTKEGYTFVGWFVGEVEFDFTKPITKNVLLTAKFEETKYNVTFDSNGGSAVSSQKVSIDGTVTRPANPTRNGYTFVAWQLNGVNYNFNAKVTADITLKAVWNQNNTTPVTPVTPPEVPKYTVSFDSNGGSAVSNQVITSGDKASVPNAPTKEYNRFVKWQLNGTDYNFDTKVTGNITLKAVWEETVTYSYTVTAWSESDLQSKVNVYRNGADISQTAQRVFNSDGANLGAYSPSAGAILVRKDDLNAIAKIYYNNAFVAITKR